LTVEPGDGCGVGGEGVGVVVREVVVVCLVVAVGDSPVARTKGEGALLQGEGLGALLFKSVGGGLEEGGVVLQLLATLGIGGVQDLGFFL
jgi:hypothetical protein